MKGISNKLNKKEIIEFVVIFLISFFICFGFIKMHYTTDTYKIADEGYSNYAINWSLKSGRVIMYSLLMLCEKTELPINIVNLIFTITGIIISCIAVLIIKNIIINFKKDKVSIKKEFVILTLSYFTIFNFMYIEAIYFLEIIIISLSILLFVLATKCIVERKKHYIIKALLLVILGVTAYQGTISFFIGLSLSMLLIKNEKVNKSLVKDIITVVVITIIAVLLNIILVKIICTFLQKNQTRFRIDRIYENFMFIIHNANYILLNTAGLLKKYYFAIYLLLSIILSLTYCKIYNKEFINYFNRVMLIVIIVIGACFSVFLATSSSFECGRMYIILGALPSIILIFLIENSTILENKNIFKYILYFMLMIWTIVNITTYIIRIAEARKTNSLEKEYCNNIAKYLQENNIEAKEGIILSPLHLDRNKIYFLEEIPTRNALTINAIRGLESAISGFNINTGYKIKEVEPKQKIVEKYFEEVNKGNLGINETYTMYIDNVLIMPIFIW